jgi:hypothetical protein
VRLLGLRGVQLVVSGRSAPPRIPDDCKKLGPVCAPLFYDGLDYVGYTPDTRGRFFILRLPDGGELVVEQFVLPKGKYRAGLRVLRPLLDHLALAGE